MAGVDSIVDLASNEIIGLEAEIEDLEKRNEHLAARLSLGGSESSMTRGEVRAWEDSSWSFVEQIDSGEADVEQMTRLELWRAIAPAAYRRTLPKGY